MLQFVLFGSHPAFVTRPHLTNYNHNYTTIVMASKKTAPYGDWESPISVDSIVSKTRSLSAPRANVLPITILSTAATNRRSSNREELSTLRAAKTEARLSSRFSKMVEEKSFLLITALRTLFMSMAARPTLFYPMIVSSFPTRVTPFISSTLTPRKFPS